MGLRYICLKDENGRLRCVPETQHSFATPSTDLSAPSVIADEMDPTQHPCDQRFYTSKSKFRSVSREHGKIEVGNEYDAFMSMKPTMTGRPPVAETLKNAWELHQTLQGKSEGERREIEARFHGSEQD